MILDLIIRNGTVVDGTGAPGRQADIGVKDGKITAIGKITEDAREVIDATGEIVAPGFVDAHTHLDAQSFWDKSLSPSCFHGVTTVIGGNCGFSIAPLNGKSDDAEYLMRMLARVEGMPLEALQIAVPWNWRSFGEFLDALDGTLALNAAFMVGHSAMRRYVMGERAVGGKATPEDIDKMEKLLDQSIQEGGLGFSSTISRTHNDMEGNPVPSRHAADGEIFALAKVISRHEGTVLEFLPDIVEDFTDVERERLTQLSLAAQRPLNWNVLNPDAKTPNRYLNHLSASDYAAERGASIFALASCQPASSRINFVSAFIIDSFNGWAETMHLDLADKIKALSDPKIRKYLNDCARAETSSMIKLANWGTWRIDQVVKPANKKFEKKLVQDLADETGQDPFDAMLDLAVSEDLKTVFMVPEMGGDEASWKLRGDVWLDDRVIIGASDAGAHLDMIDSFAFATKVLGNGVRERKLLGLEEAVRQLTSIPARYMGLRDRGELKQGNWADIVIFNADKVGCGPIHTRFDLPGGSGRVYAEAEGVEHVFVNGEEIVRGKGFIGKTPGRILRSGKDTYTVNIPTKL